MNGYGQSAAGYVTYDAATDRYGLTPEQALVFAQQGSPDYLMAGFELALTVGELALAVRKVEPRLETAFRTGEGIGWHEQDEHLSCTTVRFFEPGVSRQPRRRMESRPWTGWRRSSAQARWWPTSAAGTASRRY